MKICNWWRVCKDCKSKWKGKSNICPVCQYSSLKDELKKLRKLLEAKDAAVRAKVYPGN